MAPVIHAHLQATVTLVLLLSMLSLAAGGKLLVVPVDGSHWLSMREVLDRLSQKGHEIVVVAPEASLQIKPSKNLIMKTYPVPFTQEEMEESLQEFLQVPFEEGSLLGRFFKVYEGMKNLSVISIAGCRQLLYNKELIRYLEESKFDALFTDPVVPCGQILAEHLSLPSVFFLRGVPCGLDLKATQCPSPPSYVPRAFTAYSDHMNFPQRVKNLLFEFLNYFLCDFAFQPFAEMASEFLHQTMTVSELLSHASIWLMRFDFVLDYPRPLMPNTIFIGGVHCAHKELPQVGDTLVSIHAVVHFCVHRGGISSSW
ncbi:UDP-glucuronosyltransferase 1A1-like [Melanerpes formicivorus]|uniref:UDP-glucuronosyltransferase 1A1-like n=1 Tax=Melanerpes formicivorus TaxID=211600 RepID=UPI00358F432B